jgi:uncharacterized protein
VKLFDVNILVNAHREDAPHHAPCRRVIEESLRAPASFGLSPIVLSGFIRVVTHRRIFEVPTPIADAVEFCERLKAYPQAVVVEPGRRHWEIFRALCIDARAEGNLIPDAYLAALAIESGCEFVSTDRDFARFPALSWSDPLTA